MELSGLNLGTLTVGKSTFREVRVKSIDGRSLLFTHRDGLGSVRLRDLPSDIQARLGYDPASAPADAPPPSPAAARPPASTTAAAPDAAAAARRIDRLLLACDSPPELRASQTLQPEFIRLNLSAKNQGRRPSCAIYAIVGALEFQNFRLTGTLERLSEEYLVWATRRSLGQTGPASALPQDAEGEPAADAGYTLPSVVTALQIYGIPPASDMPNQPGLAPGQVPPPDDALVERARARRLVFIAPLPGHDPAGRLASLVHALNAGFPVPAGLRWPADRSIRGGVLAEQRPLAEGAHAVVFLGYECTTGHAEDAWFVFKNSYGPRWGQGGYGRASGRYLARHLLDAYVLDVNAAGAPAP